MLDVDSAATPNRMTRRRSLEESDLGWTLADAPGIARWFEPSASVPRRAFAVDPYGPRHPNLQEETA